MARRNEEMKFAHSGPFMSRKTLGRKLGSSFAPPQYGEDGRLVRYTPSPERYTIQTTLRPEIVDAIIAAFGRSAK